MHTETVTFHGQTLSRICDKFIKVHLMCAHQHYVSTDNFFRMSEHVLAVFPHCTGNLFGMKIILGGKREKKTWQF